MSVCMGLSVKMKTASHLTTAYITHSLPYMGKVSLFGQAPNLKDDYFKPVVKVPPQLLSVDPAWRDCRLQPYAQANRIVPLVPQEPTKVPIVDHFITATITASPKAHVMNLIPQQTPVRL